MRGREVYVLGWPGGMWLSVGGQAAVWPAGRRRDDSDETRARGRSMLIELDVSARWQKEKQACEDWRLHELNA